MDEISTLQARVKELEMFESVVRAVAVDMERDGIVMLADIENGDKFALVKRFRAIMRAKLKAQAEVDTLHQTINQCVESQ